MTLGSRYKWVILGVAFLSQMSNALVSQMIAPLAPLFQPELGLSKAQVGLFNSAIFAGWWVVMLAAGTLTDRIGVRRMMSVGQSVTGVVILSMALVGSFFQAVAVMFLAGLASGTVLPSVSKAIVEWFSPRARATALGLKQAAVPVGGMLTAAILPAVGLAFGWRAAVALIGLVLIAGGGVTWVFYRDVRPTGPVAKETPTSIREGLAHVLRNRYLWALSMTSVLLIASQMALLTYLALYFNDVVLVSLVPDPNARIVAAGGYLALCQFGGAFGRVFWGAVSDRLLRGRRMVALAAVAGVSAVMPLLVMGFGPGYPLWLMGAILFAYGATAIGWNGLFQAAAAECVDRRYMATGLGFSLTMNQIGNMGAPPLFGYVVDISGSYSTSWLLAAATAGGGALLAAVVSRREKQHA